jgi:ubiquinol-cytochrome c reductase cytochrome c1 subunit
VVRRHPARSDRDRSLARVDYLYTYLLTFYKDPTRPFGVNNAAFPNAGMPHVLWELQGMQNRFTRCTRTPQAMKSRPQPASADTTGQHESARVQEAMADLTNFMAYVGEPIKLERQRIGIWVLLFLALATVVFYLLKKEYWKDVH